MNSYSVTNIKHFAERPNPVLGIVIHFFSCRNTLPNDPYNIDETVRILNEYKASYHGIVDPFGDIYRMLRPDQVAYHAGVSQLYQYRDYDVNLATLGYAYYGILEEAPTNHQYLTLAALCQSALERHNWLKPNWIVGHDMVSGSWIRPDYKVDPGPLFDWKYFFYLIHG